MSKIEKCCGLTVGRWIPDGERNMFFYITPNEVYNFFISVDKALSDLKYHGIKADEILKTVVERCLCLCDIYGVDWYWKEEIFKECSWLSFYLSMKRNLSGCSIDVKELWNMKEPLKMVLDGDD